MLTECNPYIQALYKRAYYGDMQDFRLHLCQWLTYLLPFDYIDWHYRDKNNKSLGAVLSWRIDQIESLSSPTTSLTAHLPTFSSAPICQPVNSLMGQGVTLHQTPHQIDITIRRAESLASQRIKLLRNPQSAEFSGSDIQLLSLLVPHLVESLSCALFQRLDEAPALTALLDKHLHIIEATPSFTDLLKRHINANRIMLPINAAQQRLPIPELAHCLCVDAVGELYRVVIQANSGELLSQAEHNVLACITQGQTNKEIARTLNISASTVNNHLTSLYRKLGVHNRVQAIKAGYATRH